MESSTSYSNIKNQVENKIQIHEALLEWSNLNFEDTKGSIKHAVKVMAKTFSISRVSIWMYNEDASGIICRSLYDLDSDSYSDGYELLIKDYPKYFEAINTKKILIANEARADLRTSQFTENYFKPLDIYSLLDIPLIQSGELVGVICHEATKSERIWSIEEQNFSMMLANKITLSLEIKKRQEVQDELLKQYALVNNIIDTVPVRIFWKDKEGTYLGANKLFLQDAQLHSLNDIIGKNDFEMPWADTEAQAYRDDDLEVMNTLVSRLHFEETQTTVDGKTIVLSTSKVPLCDSEDNVIGVLGSYADITEQKTAQDLLIKQKNTLHHQAHHDALTGLPNRVLFNDRLEHAIETANRNKTKVALLFIDLDHFKEINDSLGHNTGDEVLKVVTSRLKESLRNQDTIARLGGDEFTIILENLATIESASHVAQSTLDILSQPMDINNNILYVSTSIGISIYPNDGSSNYDLLKFADSAMYKAKDEGRNNFQFYDSKMTETAFERVVMETALRSAINNEEFIVHYQPQVAGKDNKLIGMEALVRWKHPNMGLIPPVKFIPLAEITGLIVELDRVVMKIAMTQVSKWYKAGLHPGTLAMNLAVKQLQHKDCLTKLMQLLEETECKPEWIELEVTESQIMNNPEEAIKKLQAISDLGIKLAVDDFGTGYSSLAYLKKLPIDKLKIDREFIKDLPEDEEDAEITKAVIALSKSLNLRVMAEGVETIEQKDFLVENGCENIQGYFYSKPIPADELEGILRNGLKSEI